MIKKIVIRLSVLMVIMFVLNLIYSYTLFKKDLRELYPEASQIEETQNMSDIFYFGESSNVTYKPNDSTKSSISELCNLFFPDLKIQAITKYATHGGIYLQWLKHIQTGLKNPKAIVITLNLRSFDAAWIHSKLETKLSAPAVLTAPYPKLLNRFLLALQAYDNKTEMERESDMLNHWKTVPLKFPFEYKYKTVADWDAGMAAGTYTKLDGSWDIEKINLACHNIKSFAFNIEPNNPRIRDFDKIKDWCRTNNITLYLNLMSENIEYADSLVGKELVFLMKQNRDFLVQRYASETCKVVDNLELVKGNEFIDTEWTTEHYIYKGRMRIAKNLAKAMQTQFKTNYKAVY